MGRLPAYAVQYALLGWLSYQTMQFSDFGSKFAGKTGIGQLMDDLTAVQPAGGAVPLMLGGGNPARIPEIEHLIQEQFSSLANRKQRLADIIAGYGGPGGQDDFKQAVAALLSDALNKPLSPDHVAVTNGSQSAFFLLFNLLAGPTGATTRRIVLPMVPEYIGYGDITVSPGTFSANRPTIEQQSLKRFKYRINFDTLELGSDTGAMCVSRPTNPSANVLTDDEIGKLQALSQEHNVPLIIDGAYGAPFPQLIHKPVSLEWNNLTVLCLSLSKLGMPSLRTGLIIADPVIISALTRMNAVINLSTGSLGQQLLLELFQSKQILQVCRDVIQPFYQQKLDNAVNWFDEAMDDVDVRLHQPEGAFFLWAWFPRLKITSQVLYERLKARGVVVVPGHYFFPGLDANEVSGWIHQHQCIRISYAGSETTVKKGIQIIADEVKSASTL